MNWFYQKSAAISLALDMGSVNLRKEGGIVAIRWKRYHSACKGKRSEGDRHGKVAQKGIDCKGRRGSRCPKGIPKDCGGWAFEYREIDGRWVSKIFPGICKTEANELYEEMRSNVRRGNGGITTDEESSNLAEYAKTYIGA